MIAVRSVLETKGHEVWSISPQAHVIDALKIMAEKNIGALLVVEGTQLVGIFSERDYARKIILKGETSRTTLLRDVMTTNIISIRPEQSIEECMALMTSNHIRHLPVLANSTLTGIISIGDIVKAIISEREYTIKQLENYITGTR